MLAALVKLRTMYEQEAVEELEERALTKLLTWKILQSGSIPFERHDKAKRLAEKTLSIYQQGRAGELTHHDLERHDMLLSKFQQMTGESFEDSYEECSAEISGMPTTMLVLSQ